LGQRFEDKRTLTKSPVRDRQSGLIQHLLSKQDEIHIERPRSPGKRPRAPTFQLDLQK